MCSSGPAHTVRVEEGKTTAELKELVSGRAYETWLTASTAAGEGTPTRRVAHAPTHRGYHTLQYIPLELTCVE
jgi:hypothetical protein